MDPNPAITHLYSCSRWAGADPSMVIAEYIRIGEETCHNLRLTTHTEDQPYEKNYTQSFQETNSRSKIDIWGEVKNHLVIFIHGGFWQEGSRKLVSPAAVNLVKHDIAMAAVGYEFASSVRPLSQVVLQVAKAVDVRFTLTPIGI